jgi:D-tyrosyl-tRNA(Tyr) deacylase
MRAVVQRVSRAELMVVDEGVERTHASIGAGLTVLVGIEAHDTPDDLAWMARKLVGVRIFEDADGKMNLSITDAAPGGPDATRGILLVPNFTVAGRAHKGRRPDFTGAMHPDLAASMFDDLRGRISSDLSAASPGSAVVTGVFGAHMHVRLENDGPVTIWLDSRA